MMISIADEAVQLTTTNRLQIPNERFFAAKHDDNGERVIGTHSQNSIQFGRKQAVIVCSSGSFPFLFEEMKDPSRFASFVAPSAFPRSATNCCSEFSPIDALLVGGSRSNYRDSLALRSEPSVASLGLQEQPAGVYEAVLPQTETLVGMGFILVLCVALYWVWENQVVPVSRTKLAISKNRGDVKDYLDELKASAPSTSTAMEPSSAQSLSLQSANVTTAVDSSEETSVGTLPISTTSSQTTTSGDDRAFERWLFTDWLEDNKSEGKTGGRKKEPALPILKSARWNSGDNPVVVAAFLMLVGLVVTVLTERLGAVL
jgi:hypothetical protein